MKDEASGDPSWEILINKAKGGTWESEFEGGRHQMNLIQRVQDHPWRDASLEEKETSEVGVFIRGIIMG